MDVFGKIIIIGFLFFILATPIILSLKGYNNFRILALSFPLMAAFILLGSYWPHFYVDLRLELMGFDFDSMSDLDRARNVLPEFKEEATKLYWSTMGIGWPLQAFIWMVILSPYPFAVLGFKAFIKYLKRR
jgi:hypothetical protein